MNVDSPSFNMLSLCTGAGGLELGIRLAVPTARVICAVEIEAYACELLATRMEEETLDDAPIWTDLRTFDGRPWRGIVDCIAGGYPCQPFSVAGKQLGAADPRHLWPYIGGRRPDGQDNLIVQLGYPRWLFFENVANHLRVGFADVHADLRSMGYRVAAGLFTAEEVGATHKRERLFVLSACDESTRCSETLGHTNGKRLAQRSDEEIRGSALRNARTPTFPPNPNDHDNWQIVLSSWPNLAPAVERPLRGMAHGMAPRVDRLRLCGNGVVPDVAALAFHTLAAALSAD